MSHNIIINEELKNLLPPLSSEEYAGLEESVVKDGCLSPLVVWNDILVDGHHRYEICTKHKISFSIKNIVLENLDDAKLWAGKHQDNRRNLTPYRRAEIALKLKDAIAAKAKKKQLSGLKQNTVLANLPERTETKDTRKELAEIAGVGSRTLAKVDFIAEHGDEETKDKLRSGVKGTSIDKEYNRLKEEKKSEKKPRSKSTKNSAKAGNNKSETITVSLKNSPKVNERYSCGAKFEPDPDDDYFDWITDEEREELYEMRKTCPNRLVPQIHNFTIQNIPEHKPDQLLACLFSLFKVRYREKLAYGLLRKMFNEDSPELAISIVSTLFNEFQNR